MKSEYVSFSWTNLYRLGLNSRVLFSSYYLRSQLTSLPVCVYKNYLLLFCTAFCIILWEIVRHSFLLLFYFLLLKKSWIISLVLLSQLIFKLQWRESLFWVWRRRRESSRNYCTIYKRISLFMCLFVLSNAFLVVVMLYWTSKAIFITGFHFNNTTIVIAIWIIGKLAC